MNRSLFSRRATDFVMSASSRFMVWDTFVLFASRGGDSSCADSNEYGERRAENASTIVENSDPVYPQLAVYVDAVHASWDCP